eukprot:CAMPEP_0117444170 /NCGR_PEP_ID=MMETSP0759-20121206/5093_1 /TAXON_ID=63605 /ORGANISM="Percolomonas cosmopolitus, Strain WS" /LENGTH=46 /DNA_ID= /DNA_START= /DNA_END= /DNA_ORIENTATION=
MLWTQKEMDSGEFDEEHEKEKERIRHFLGLPQKKKDVEPAKEEINW